MRTSNPCFTDIADGVTVTGVAYCYDNADGLTAATPTAAPYPNLHGDNILTADQAGARTGVRAMYDPFGNPIDPVTNLIGTLTADDSVGDNASGDADYGWVGQHRKLYGVSGVARLASRRTCLAEPVGSSIGGPVRMGWNWVGSGYAGTNVFRVGIGPARGIHLDLWTAR